MPDLQPSEDIDVNVVACPATIYTRFMPPFEVTDVNSWQLMPNAVFATGRLKGSEEERDFLIPLASISYIDYHFDELVEYVQSDE